MECCFRDVVLLDDCDKGVQKLCDLIGWRNDLEQLYTKGREKLRKQQDQFLKLKQSFIEKISEIPADVSTSASIETNANAEQIDEGDGHEQHEQHEH